MRINYTALGCKVNLYEAVAIANEFVKKGFELVDENAESDVCIINTCTVTATSDSKSRKAIRQVVKRNPNAIIVVMGCYSQLNGEEAISIPGVDIVLGTQNRHMIYDLVTEKLLTNCLNRSMLVSPFSKETKFEELKLDFYDHKTRGFVKIQDGCENFCSYCAIPFARGPIRSRDKDNVISEIQSLTNQGMKEIVLTGINTGTYGKDLSSYRLSDLIEEIVNQVPNLGRIRISSIEVTEIDDKLLDVLKRNSSHICNHLHIPMQGGADSTLKRMNRKYNVAYFKEAIRKIRNIFPTINITTDCLAGFSGEAEDDFLEAIKFVEEVKFGEMHIFPYSPRPNTVAFGLPNRINGVEKKRRVDKLLAINKINALKYREMFLGKTLEVLVENNENGIAFGHTSNYLEVEFESQSAKANDIIKVVITEVGYPISKGCVINE